MSKVMLSALVVAAAAGTCVGAKWARVQEGEVVEVFSKRPDFHPSVMATIVECPDNVEPKWKSNGGSLEAPRPPLSPAEKERASFDTIRGMAMSASGVKARKLMADMFRYKLDGPLATGYPSTVPMCTNAVGQALTVAELMDYIQEREDEGAPNQELARLRQEAKDARLYIKNLKGD